MNVYYLVEVVAWVASVFITAKYIMGFELVTERYKIARAVIVLAIVAIGN